MNIEISPSNRAKCFRCNNKIERLEIRLDWAGSKICNKCIIKLLDEVKKDLDE